MEKVAWMRSSTHQPLRGQVDADGQWWRRYHLFQQLLQHQLADEYSEDEIRDLHRRAGHWYAEHGFLDEAFAQALAARDLDTAVALVERRSLRHDEPGPVACAGA
ncbi:MAG: hypothetical protein R3A10_01365 [Caldilineaceae bacterium]